MADNYNSYYSASHALVIGIDNYLDQRLSPLGNAEANALALADVLREEPHNFNVRLLLGDDATVS